MKHVSWIVGMSAIAVVFALVLAHSAAVGQIRSPAGKRAPREQVTEQPSADEVCKIELTEEKIDNPPERKTEIERLEAPSKQKLTDLKIVDQKYVATLRIVLPTISQEVIARGAYPRSGYRSSSGGAYRGASEFLNGQDDKEGMLQFFERSRLLAPYDLVAMPETISASLERMIEFIPEQRRPAKKLVEFFISNESNRAIMSPDTEEGYREFRVLAMSPEQAQERTEALLHVFDHGFSRPIQLALLKKRQDACKELQLSESELAAATERLEAIKKELEEYADFTPDMLSGLRVQQLQLEVDLAGVKARLATCEKLLKGAMTEERRKQVEDMKIGAEIELSGFEARRAKSAEFVAKVKTKGELSVNTSIALGKVSSARQQREFGIKTVQLLDQEIAAFAPVTIEDNKITIQPIEWTQ